MPTITGDTNNLVNILVLTAAVATALDPGLPHVTSGAVVVMNDQIHSARWVQKNHTQRRDAFTSGEPGVLGVIAEAPPVFLRQDPAPVIPRLLATDTESDAAVALLTAALDQDTRLIDHLPRLGYREGSVADTSVAPQLRPAVSSRAACRSSSPHGHAPASPAPTAPPAPNSTCANEGGFPPACSPPPRPAYFSSCSSDPATHGSRPKRGSRRKGSVVPAATECSATSWG